MKNKVITLLLAIAFFSAYLPMPLSANTCEGLFVSNKSPDLSQPAWISAVLISQTEIARLKSELSKPEALRANKDPRWFSRFRKPAKNPVTLQLAAQIKANEMASALLLKEFAAWNSLAEIESLADRLQFPDADAAGKIRLWIAHELNEVRGMFAVEFKSEGQLKSAQAAVRKLKSELGRLSVDQADSDRALKTLRAIIRFDLGRLEVAARDDVERIMGRSIKPDTLHELQVVARKANRPLNQILEMMRIADDLGMTRKTADGKGTTGINDKYIAILVRLAVENGRTPDQLVELFKAIDEAGVEKKDEKVVFSFEDHEVTALAQIAVEQNVSVDFIMKRAFEIRDLGKTYQGTGGFSHLSDTAIASLTLISLRPGAGTAEKLVDAVFSVYDLHRTKEENRSPSDLALTVILRSTVSNQVSIEKAVENFRSYFSLVEKTASQTKELRRFAVDDEIALWSELGTILSLTPNEVVETARRLAVMVDDTVGARTLHASLEDAFKLANAKGHKVPTDSEIQAVVQARLVQHRDPISWIRDQGVRAAQARAAAKAAAARSSSGSRTSSGTSSSSSSSDGTGLGWTIGSDGLHANLGISSGVGIDLSDGSLTLNLGGGISFDTDGSGVSFRF
jgi:hypothetical protein